MPESKTGIPSVGWIKFLAIVTAWLTIILVALIIVLGMFVWRLEMLTDSLFASRRSAQLSSSTPEQSLTPTPTEAPALKAIPLAARLLTRHRHRLLSLRERIMDIHAATDSNQSSAERLNTPTKQLLIAFPASQDRARMRIAVSPTAQTPIHHRLRLAILPRDSHLTGAEGCGPAQKLETGWLLAQALRSQPESVWQLVRARQRRRSPNQLERTR